jgi:hypothetical protein
VQSERGTNGPSTPSLRDSAQDDTAIMLLALRMKL